MRPIRIVYFSTWAEGLHDAASYLASLPQLEPRVSDPADGKLRRMGRLDRDWDAECLRAFASIERPDLTALPALIAGPRGLLELTAHGSFDEASVWLILINQKPAALPTVIGRLLRGFRERGGQILYWAYDDASRNMPCFATEVAPHLSVLIHDEWPLDETVRAALPADCLRRHESWTANIVPFSYPMDESPEERIVFLGSKLGITQQRRKQIRALEAHFEERFVCITDHSIDVDRRGRFASIKVHVCPEGRMFGTPSMSRAHTDRPFWAGCLGQVPVSENSKRGDRLPDLVERGLILSYDHGDIPGLIRQCERALTLGVEERRTIHGFFNRHGTVGPLVARMIAERMERSAAQCISREIQSV